MPFKRVRWMGWFDAGKRGMICVRWCFCLVSKDGWSFSMPTGFDALYSTPPSLHTDATVTEVMIVVRRYFSWMQEKNAPS